MPMALSITRDSINVQRDEDTAASMATGVVEKPFRIGELLDVVRGAIRSAPRA